MALDDFRALADLLAEILEHGDHKPAGAWQDAVKAVRGRFTEMRYCL